MSGKHCSRNHSHALPLRLPIPARHHISELVVLLLMLGLCLLTLAALGVAA